LSKPKSKKEAEPLIPYADIASLPKAMREPLNDYVKRMGFLPNALKLYMHRPELLQCLIQMNNTTMRDESSHLDAELKRKVSVLCSALNHSAYCVAHTAGTMKKQQGGDGEGWGYSDDDIKQILDPNKSTVDDVETACMDYARAATIDASEVPQQVVIRLAEVLTPPQVVELACVVGFWKMYNTIHESLYVPLEDELTGDDDLNQDELLSEKAAPTAVNSTSAKVEIYTTASCPFCRRAKRLLAARGATFTEYDVENDERIHDEMVSRAGGQRAVPQIFINNAHIGGMDQLTGLDRVGELMSRLGEKSAA